MSAQLFKGWARDVDVDLPQHLEHVGHGRHIRHVWTEHELWLRDAASATTGVAFEDCMWNRYTGTSGVPFHHDSNTDIAILSLGADAEFALQPCGSPYARDAQVFTVEDGDLLFIPHAVQRTHAHSVLSHGARYSLVFRRGSASNRCPGDGARHEGVWDTRGGEQS